MNLISNPVKLSPHKGHSSLSGEIKLATYDTTMHCNIILAGGRDNEQACVCMSPQQAMALRDRMIEAYPLPKVEVGVSREQHAKACSDHFDAGYTWGFDAGKATKASAAPTWEVVTDGMDRLKVPGGWIYQSDEGVQTFVPEVK